MRQVNDEVRRVERLQRFGQCGAAHSGKGGSDLHVAGVAARVNDIHHG